MVHGHTASEKQIVRDRLYERVENFLHSYTMNVYEGTKWGKKIS